MDAHEPTIASADWADRQNDLLVADYFALRDAELAGQSYVKAEHRREVARLTGRLEKAVERKYMNVSAVLEKLGRVDEFAFEAGLGIPSQNQA